MNVDLRLPPPWTVEIAGDGSVRATSTATPGIEITAAPFAIVVDRKRAWALHAMARELGTAADNVALRVDEAAETADGWPTWFVVAERADTGDVRAFAFYHFLDYSSFATIRGPGADGHLDLLRRARPNYATDEVVALEQLWE